MPIKSIIVYTTALSVSLLTLSGCGGSQQQRDFKKSPVDQLVVRYNAITDYSIILADMDYDESADKYKHKYQILYEPTDEDTLLEEVTEWVFVDDVLFDKHKEDLGMALVTKEAGQLSKVASPPGYAGYIGNERYGQWKTHSDGGSFWEFYGKYAFMSSMFRLAFFPVRYSYWGDYRGGYYGSRPYYGSGGNRYYGTGGTYTNTNKTSTWNNKPNSFKQRVRSKVTKSATATRTKRARSASRYRSTGYRSRGGGFGK